MTNQSLESAVKDFTDMFFDEFEISYKIINSSSKRSILKNFYSIYKRWYFSTLIPNIEISPAYLINNIKQGYLPVVKCNKSRLGGFSVSIYENFDDKSVVLHDLKIIYEYADNGIFSSDKYIFNDEFYNKIYKYLYIDDLEYLNYIIIIALKIGLLKYSPALYVTAVTKQDTNFFEKPFKYCFQKIVDAAIELASEKITESLLYGNIDKDTIIGWLKNEHNVDEIFKRDLDYFFDNEINIDNEDIFDALMFSKYEIGVMFDKWFLTPFGAYLGLIIPSYTSEMNLFNEIDIFLEAEDGNKKYNGDRDTSMLLYCPCTSYYLTNRGKEYFGVEGENIPDNIFNYYNVYELIDMFCSKKYIDNFDEILCNFYPPFNMYLLKASWELDKSVWCNINVSEKIELNELADLILDFLFRGRANVISYKFYTLPENPFMTFEYPVNTNRSDNIYNKQLFSIFEDRNSLMFSFAVEYLEKYMEFDFKISNLRLYESTDISMVNYISDVSSKLRKIFK